MTRVLPSPQEAAQWLRARVTGELHTDSRDVGSGDGFIAWPGAARDARQYVDDALKAGAAACLVESEGVEPFGFNDKRVAAYAELKAAAGPIGAAYFGHPSAGLQVVAVTGTNGKTSTSWWLAQALSKAGMRCGVVGTLGIGEPGAMVFNGLTTPDPVLLQQQFKRFADHGFSACAVEASSIGIAERRLDATRISVAIFTNFTLDHLDYHGSLDAYWAAKSSLFQWPGLRTAVINIDDPKGAQLQAQLRDAGLATWSISVAGPARLTASNIQHQAAALVFDVVEGSAQHRVRASSAGLYNVSNLLGVIAAMRALGIPLAQACKACDDLGSVPGRLNLLSRDGCPLVVIDYAHTPDALEKVLQALRPVAQARSGSLWCLFGCGGNRDASKRPLMGAVAQAHSDQLMVTSDNPRNEAPRAIIDHILKGLTNGTAFDVQEDRALAIAQAIAKAGPNDVVLLAGKGHEDYQEVGGVKLAFSDHAQAVMALDARREKARLEGASA